MNYTKYDNMTDRELIREAEGYGGLIHALRERLDMRQSTPSTVFHEQAVFMRACQQQTTIDMPEQSAMYLNLIEEEVGELHEAIAQGDDVETFDAILDIIVVCIGYGLSRGWPMVEGWQEVMQSNLAKIGPDGFAKRRPEDGKILKPEGWQPPDLKRVLDDYAAQIN
jgi:predicted HAD superfamily Cof-like phosphohydrolase